MSWEFVSQYKHNTWRHSWSCSSVSRLSSAFFCSLITYSFLFFRSPGCVTVYVSAVIHSLSSFLWITYTYRKCSPGESKALWLSDAVSVKDIRYKTSCDIYSYFVNLLKTTCFFGKDNQQGNKMHLISWTTHLNSWTCIHIIKDVSKRRCCIFWCRAE